MLKQSILFVALIACTFSVFGTKKKEVKKTRPAAPRVKRDSSKRNRDLPQISPQQQVELVRTNVIKNLKEWQLQPFQSGDTSPVTTEHHSKSDILQRKPYFSTRALYSIILGPEIAREFNPQHDDPKVFAKRLSDDTLLKLYNSKINLTFVSKNKGD